MKNLCIWRKSSTFVAAMIEEIDKTALHFMLRRWLYMCIAIVAALFLFTRPVLKFQEDKGIKYVRSFTMDEKTFVLTQRPLEGETAPIDTVMSVKGLYYCNQVMLWGCILCFLCFFSNRWRGIIAVLTAVSAGVYYIFLIYYAVRISDDFYATLYPTFMAFLPAVVLQMMVMTRHNVLRTVIHQAESTLLQ